MFPIDRLRLSRQIETSAYIFTLRPHSDYAVIKHEISVQTQILPRSNDFICFYNFIALYSHGQQLTHSFILLFLLRNLRQR